MHKAITSVLLALAASAAAPSARAGIVANFVGDYQAVTPSAGWSYLWNDDSPLKTVAYSPNIAQWAPLGYDSNVTTGGGYEASVNGAHPDAAPALSTRVTAGSVSPGQTALQDEAANALPAGTGTQRFVILAYTFSAAEVAANGSDLFFENYNFVVPSDLPGGKIDVHVWKNTQLLFSSDFVGDGFGPPGFSDAIYGGHYSFGSVQADDTLYIALGARGAYDGRPLTVSYTLALTPEPGTLAGLAVAPLVLVRRRRQAR